MNLREAKKILNDNGYKVELNEDLRKAWDEVKDSVSDAVVGGMRKLSPKVQQFIQDTIPLGAALKEAGTIYGFRVEKEEGFYKLTVRNKHTSTAPDFLYIKGFRGNIEVNIDGEGWTTKPIKVHSKKELMDLLKTVIYSVDYEQPEATSKGWFKMPQNESTITEIRKYNKDNLTMNLNEAKQILKRNGYILEDTEEENSEAVKILANLHYQICNGGWEQACYNGYVDELNTYGVKKWEKDLETEFAKSPLLKKVKKVIELIKLAMEQTVMERNCPECNGEGSWEETEEDEDGYEESHTEYCDRCDGDGVVGVKTYDRVDFGSGTANDWSDAWDSNYYEQVDSDTIDDITKQSHTHSVVLDTIRGK